MWFLRLDPALEGARQLAERRRRAQNVPEVIALPRLKTKKELDDVGWQYPDEKHICQETPFGTVPFFKLIDPRDAQKAGFLERLFELQGLVFDEDVREALAETARLRRGQVWTKGMVKRTRISKDGNAYNPGITVEQGHDVYSVSLSSIARQNHPKVTELLPKSAILAHEMLIYAFPEMGSRIYKDQIIAEASICLATGENYSNNTLQINISLPKDDKNLGEALGPSGEFHYDKNDYATKFTIYFVLSYLAKDFYPGSFSIPAAKLTFTTAPFTTAIFKASGAHLPLPPREYPSDLTEDSPLRYKCPAEIIYPQLPEGTPHLRVGLVN
jgi:hypothetical protein